MELFGYKKFWKQRGVSLLTKIDDNKSDRGTYRSGFSSWKETGENKILVNGADWNTMEYGYVHTELSGVTGMLTLVIQKRKESEIVEVFRSTVGELNYFQEVMYRKIQGDDKWTVTKPDLTYKSHVSAAKQLAWVNSGDKKYDGFTYQPKKDANGFSQLDTMIIFDNKVGREQVLNTIDFYARNYYDKGIIYYNKLHEVGADVLKLDDDQNSRNYEILFEK